MALRFHRPGRSGDPKLPLRVAFDLTRLSAGGANGGIKVHLYEFLRAFQEWRRSELSLLVLCRPEIAPELAFLADNPLNELHLVEPDTASPSAEPPNLRPSPLRARRWLPEDVPDVLRSIAADVHYAAFGDSPFHDPEVPQISLLVDCLHKDLPEMLPPEEVADRERRFRLAIEQADLVQTNSKFCVERLRRHYDLSEEKVFHVYLPLHGRFNRVKMGRLPSPLDGKDYFFYPANHWPHKNHECLLIAFRKYREESQEEPWDLALTGDAPPERTAYLRELSRTLGIAESVHFLGHLDEPTFKAVWEHCGALVFPSLYEGFGLPILEAMHFQKPIACGEIPTAREIAANLPIYFDPLRPIGIAKALRTQVHQDSTPACDATLDSFQLDLECERLLRKLLAARQSITEAV